MREEIARIFLAYDRAVKDFMADAQYADGNVRHPSISEAINETVALIPNEKEIRKQQDIVWIKALMRGGIMVAEPKELEGIGGRIRKRVGTLREELTKLSKKLDDREADLINAKREEREGIEQVADMEGGMITFKNKSVEDCILIRKADWQALKGEN